MKTSYFTSFDEKNIFYRSWNYEKNKKAIVVIHRGHEHSERLDDFANNERFRSYSIFSYDLRGHGYTEIESSPVFMDYVKDLEYFIRHIKNEYQLDEKNIFIIANSIGGVIATTWVNYYTPKISGMALLAPAFKIRLYVPLAKEFISLMVKIYNKAKVPSYVKAKVLTHDKNEQKKYNEDKLITKDINAKLLLGVLKYGERMVRKASTISIPMIIFSAEKDYVVGNKGQKIFYTNLSSELKEFVTLKNTYHGIIFEENRDEVFAKMENFIRKSFDSKVSEINILPNVDSVREYNSIIVKNISIIEKIFFGIQKKSLNKLGWLSGGMDIGLTHGFDSGPSLNYIYKNKVNGKFLIGKLLDRFYLNQTGWKGIRERKKNLLSLVKERILSSSKMDMKILDVAGGVGNYLFDIKEEFPDVEIVINEIKMKNIQMGEKIIKNKQWKNIRFTNFDCFNMENYKKMEFIPDIVIISGIFELFGDNKMLDQTIKGISQILSLGGSIIYTGQPEHPQLKQIAFVLNNHRSNDWIMRIRSQQELDNIFLHNGYDKKEILVDNEGIFTVSLVKRSSDSRDVSL